jgi:hypothetical protein
LAVSPLLLNSLPFYSATRALSAKKFPLDRLLELRFGGSPAAGVGSARPDALLLDSQGKRVAVKRHQILVWISVGSRNKPRSTAFFPAILDPGCNYTLVASEWHLEKWACSATYDPSYCRIVDLVQETVASSAPPSGPAPSKPKQLLGQRLQSLQTLWRVQKMTDWLAVIESDLWLSANEPGERDELRSADSWLRLQIPAGILVRRGDSARPPLLGLRALQEGIIVQPDGVYARFEELRIDLQGSSVFLSYS